MYQRTLDEFDLIWFKLGGKEVIPMASIIFHIIGIIVFAIGVFMGYSAHGEQQSADENTTRNQGEGTADMYASSAMGFVWATFLVTIGAVLFVAPWAVPFLAQWLK